MREWWRLQRTSIAVRLRILVGAIIVLMLLGGVLSFWEFRKMSASAERLSGLERRLSSLLRLNNSLLSLQGHLRREADQRDASLFTKEAIRLLHEFQLETADVNATVREIVSQSEQHAARMAGIQAMLESLPERISTLIHLAESGDWAALHARLLNQADQTDDVVEALVSQVDHDLAGMRTRLLEDLALARRRVVDILVFSTLVSLAMAGLLGTLIARSITHPLSLLHKGARALAAGDFQPRVPVIGTDELAHVAEAFNKTTADLAAMFAEVQLRRASAEASDRALREHARELARVNADLKQFAHSASHDLQEPLRTMGLYSQLLQLQYAGRLDDTANQYLSFISLAAQQMQELITDLLTYAETAGMSREVDSRADAQSVLDRVLATFEAQVRAQNATINSDPLPSVRAFETHVRQLFQNLIGNALKYRSHEPPLIHIWAERREGYWEFAVRDNGIGIDPKYAPQIFGVFQRLHGRKYPGTGIGLAICQRIAEGYGGRIWVESDAGRGATFRFTLPA